MLDCFYSLAKSHGMLISLFLMCAYIISQEFLAQEKTQVYMHLLEKFHAIDLQLSRLEFRCFPKIFWMCFDIWSLEKLSVTGNHL
ncbi:hypothetical protein CIPAW_08G139100 [Carya illinoinensis]|uniref:Uncharacterized protein n=1 Tax=Carya illinoinensis TaxID=32201 RepID=A0A8T1PN78_CARIL|nr:hypothetical protein CIPAW_08G139100 [Carya illinoinensis]